MAYDEQILQLAIEMRDAIALMEDRFAELEERVRVLEIVRARVASLKLPGEES
jgi:hypothetical protein